MWDHLQQGEIKMKKTMTIAAVMVALSVGVFSVNALRPSTVSSPVPSLVQTLEKKSSEKPLDNVFNVLTIKKPLSFKTRVGGYLLENSQELTLLSEEKTRNSADEFLQKCKASYVQLEGDLRHSVESQKDAIVVGKVGQDAIVLAPLKAYAKNMEQNVKDAYKKIFLQDDSYHFEVLLGEGNMFTFQGIELLTIVLQAFDQVGVDVMFQAEVLKLVVPDQDPRRVVQLRLPVIKCTGKLFEERVVAPDISLGDKVYKLLPKKWINEVPYLRMRSLTDPVPGAYTPGDKNHVIYYNREGLHKQVRALLDAPTNPFPFATLPKVEQEKLMERIAQMLFYHEQVHSMTKKVIGALPKDPTCKDCEEKKFGIIEMLAFLVTFHHFKDVETRYVIMRIITQMNYGDYKLTYDKFVTPMIVAAVDTDPKKQCEKGKEINVECVFTEHLLTDDVVDEAIKKAVSYGEEYLIKNFLPL